MRGIRNFLFCILFIVIVVSPLVLFHLVFDSEILKVIGTPLIFIPWYFICSHHFSKWGLIKREEASYNETDHFD